MNKKLLLVLPVSILVLAACTPGNSGSTGSANPSVDSSTSVSGGDSANTSTDGSTNTSTNPSVEPEYISQAVLDSLKGSIKLSGTYTLTDTTLPEYTYSGSVTRIYDGNDFYSYDISDYGVREMLSTNIEGYVALVRLGANNEVERVPFEDDEGDPVAWEDMCANPLEDLLAADFLKQSDGSYAATNAEDRSLLAFAAYGYYHEIESASVTVSGGVITSISFVSAAYVDEFDSTMVDSGTVTVSEHGTATAPEVEVKPVEIEHAELWVALESLVNASDLKVSTSEDIYDDESGELSGEPTVWDEYITNTAYYSTYPEDISDTDEPVYVTSGYVLSDANGAYGFMMQEDGSVELTGSYSSIRDLSVIKQGYFEGFSPSLFESKGNGVFEAYEDTIDIVAPYVVMDEIALDNIITSLTITVENGEIASIVYDYEYYYFGLFYRGTYNAVVTFDTENVTIPVDLTEAVELANTFADIDEEGMIGTWTDGTNTLVIGAVSITFNGTKVTDIEVLGAIFNFVVGDITYRVEFTDQTQTALRVEPSEGEIMILTPPEVGEMPADIKQAVYDTLGVELTLPGVEGGVYSYETGADEDGNYIIIHIDNTTLEEYIAIVIEAGFTAIDYTDSYGMWFIDDANELLWPQVYEGVSSGIDIKIWNY